MKKFLRRLFKNLITTIFLLICALVISSFTYAEEAPPPDWLTMMSAAARAGDIDAGRAASMERNAYIEEHQTGETKIDFDEMYLLAQFISAEAGEDWLSDEMRLCVGEVALNRVKSPQYPSSLRRVIFQRGEFDCCHDLHFNEIVPSRDCVSVSLRLMLGERMLDESVIYYGSEPQGEIYNTFVDKVLGYTYFCRAGEGEAAR